MDAEIFYGIGYYLAGSYHVLCRDGTEYRFQRIEPPCSLETVKFEFYEARNFIDTHPVCANISNHEIRIMTYREIQNILKGTSAVSSVKSLSLSSEEEEEEPLH